MTNQIDILKKRIGARLKVFRKAADLTQDDLAARMDRSPEGISNIERGSSLPPLDTLCAFAEVLGVSVFDFFDGADADLSGRREEVEAAIRAKVRDLTDKEVETALRLISALHDD